MTEKTKCVICSGTGIQEETMKGYRRYKCWSCDGAKVVDNPSPKTDTGEEQMIIEKDKIAMLAKDMREDKLEFPCYAEPKYDGVRVLAHVHRNTKSVDFFFRSGKEVHTLEHLIEPLLNLDVEEDCFWVDGEVINEEGFMKCVGDVRRKSKQAPHLEYGIFDLFFENDERTYLQRKDYLYKAYRDMAESDNIFVVDFVQVDSLEEIRTVKGEWEDEDDNCEGIMIKKDNRYVHKRTWDWMKMKDELSVDFPVVGAYEGKGKYDGMLGGLIVENPKTNVQIRVGGGYNDDERYRLWNNIADQIGKIAEIKYQYMTPKGSLRHPVFMGFRIDK